MKKYFLIISLLILTSCFGFAQTAEDEGDDFQPPKKTSVWGAKFGLNFSHFVDTTVVNIYTSKPGFLLGVFYRSELLNILSYQLEAAYSSIGTSYTETYPTTSLSYLNLGALAKYYPLTQTLGANIQLGVQYGYLLGASSNSLDLADMYNSTDFDLLAGVGFDFGFGLCIEARYLYGLMSCGNYINHRDDPLIRFMPRNIAYQIQFGWAF